MNAVEANMLRELSFTLREIRDALREAQDREDARWIASEAATLLRAMREGWDHMPGCIETAKQTLALARAAVKGKPDEQR